MHLSALSPFGPIFGKELRTTARRKRTFLLRFLYLGILLLVLWGIYLESSSSRYYDDGGGIARRAQRAAELGQAFFNGFSMFCVISMALICPILTATAINSERQAKTLPVLLMTPITSWQIVSGKLLSRLLAAFTLIGLSLPVLAVVRLLGGVELGRMLSVLGVCVVTGLFTASIGLFYSAFMSRAYSVILLSFGTLLFLYLFVPMILTLMIQPRGAAVGYAQFMAATNPFAATAFLARGGTPFRVIGAMPTIIVHLIGTGVLVMWTGAILRRQARKEGEGERSTRVEASPDFSTLTALTVPNDVTADGSPAPASPGTRSSRRQRNVSDNPVLWRELRRPLTTRRWQSVAGTIISIVLLLITYLAVGSSSGRGLADPDFQIGYACIFCALLTLLACVISATAIAGEKESDTWTILLGTPLSAREIVLGKLAGQFRRLLWPSVLVFSHFALFTVTGVLSTAEFIAIVWVIVTFNVLWIATGLYFSLRVRKVTLAVIFNLMSPLAAYLLVPLVLMIVGNLAGNRDLPDVTLWYMPYPFLASGVEGFRRGSHRFYLPSGTELDLNGFLMAIFIVGSIYLVLTAVVVWYTAARFDRIVGRAIQREPVAAGDAGKSTAFLPHGE